MGGKTRTDLLKEKALNIRNPAFCGVFTDFSQIKPKLVIIVWYILDIPMKEYTFPHIFSYL